MTPDEVRRLAGLHEQAAAFNNPYTVDTEKATAAALRALADVAEAAIEGYQPTGYLSEALDRLEALQP
jgi:hypothetical protein